MKYLSNKKGFLGIDNKSNIKENVVVGRLIPAGTGLAQMKEDTVEEEEQTFEAVDLEEALSEALKEEEE